MLKLPAKNKKLLLHTCCAPCSAHIIFALREAKIDFSVFFYNPNIFPQKEYNIRKNELIRYCQKNKLSLIIAESEKNQRQWEDSVRGLELEPERGKRCSRCITHRLEKVARYAFQNDYDIIATTLSGSKWKDPILVGESGEISVKEYIGVDYWSVDWRKHIDPELEKIIGKEESFYRQKYCGCFYSIGDNLK